EIVARDEAGAEARATTPVRVARPARVALTAPEPGASVAGEVAVRFTFDGLPSDVARGAFLVDDGRVLTLTGLRAGVNTIMWNADAAGLGPHTLEVRLTDTLGDEVNATVTVNVIPPLEVEVLAPVPNAEVAGQVPVRYRASANAADLEIGRASCRE